MVKKAKKTRFEINKKKKHDQNNIFSHKNIRYLKCTFFLKEKFLYENEPQKPQNLKKMLRKSPGSNTNT